jgi:hypothetical protein
MASDGIAIEASPTKDFFIHMLTRDIDLIPAIGDLVDNCVDGALRLRKEGNFKNLFIRIAATGDGFTIEDNCGGIPLEVARKYAFRFGRPEGMTDTPHSIGQFGVGMKRALFKLGGAFEVISRSNSDSFEVKVDVSAWRDQPEWKFTLVEHEEPALDEAGTRISVAPLHDSVQDRLDSDTFIKRLATTLGSQHQRSIAKGLLITLNTKPIGSRDLDLLTSSELKPAVASLKLYEESEAPVTIRMYAGVVDESSPPDAGWYVYCNGRLVVGADKTEATGWGTESEHAFPRYHNRYGRFRGYAFFDSDDSGRLPWTTTKTGIERESPVYQRGLQRMVELGRPVLAFLRQVEKEIEEPPEAGAELEPMMGRAQAVSVGELNVERAFHYARPKLKPKPQGPPTQSIQYRRPITEIEQAKDVLRVTSAREVGERTFEYFFKRECGES